MGSDDLFYKQRERRAESLARRQGKRAPYKKVLIVCEGKETEPNYFNEIIQRYKIRSANVVITAAGGSSPQSVFASAKKRYRKDKEQGDPFDKIFCVFDKDSHSSYDEVSNKIQHMKPKDTFIAITSVPCFEYWFLLHYEYSTRLYSSAQVLPALKKHFPSYRKNRTDIFSTLRDNLETAKENAKQALQEASETNTDNPSTKVHELVEFLQEINP